MTAKPSPASDDLRRLAAAHGVATSYRDERRQPVDVDSDVVVKVLAHLDPNGTTVRWENFPHNAVSIRRKVLDNLNRRDSRKQ